MPETPDEFYERVSRYAATLPGGRLQFPAEAAGDIFPFELDGLVVREIQAPVVPEPPRNGECGADDCRRCRLTAAGQGEQGAIWADDRWLLVAMDDVRMVPFAALLVPRQHLDLIDLDAGMAAELGRLAVEIERAVMGLGNIGRVHVNKWGDGGAHLHLWFIARPAGALQLRGSCLPIWLDLLPDGPEQQVSADQRRVAEAVELAYGGRALP
jgi:diadenosine tetraphosphate (Ap4A) HIT family hydrolase